MLIEHIAYLTAIQDRLQQFPIVSVLGSRQVGKTTLARQLAANQPTHSFDLGDPDT